MKRYLAVLALCVSAAGMLGAIELTNGRMKLSLDERNGRFSLYYMTDVSKKSYVALLDDKESRTTYPTLYIDQKAYKLGEAAEFRVSASKDGSGYLVQYRSSMAVVRQYFSFVASPGSPLADGLSIRFEIENVSERDLSVGLRYLFDTWLGERENAHFMSSAPVLLANETLLQSGFDERHLASVGMGASVHFVLAAPATKPDRIIASNWKRLNDSAWSLEVNPARNFTLMPYSINDSALALFYDPAVLKRAAVRGVSVLLSGASPGSYAQAQAQTASATPAAPSGSAPIEPSAQLDVMADLISARSLLASINEALARGEEPSADQLAAFSDLLSRLEERKAGY
jgi:hypothetical protein